MYVNINLSVINAFTGTQVFLDAYGTKVIFKDYGINAFISLFYQNGCNVTVCNECVEDMSQPCTTCRKNHIEHLILQTDVRYIDDVVDVIENESGVARSIILYACHLTEFEIEE